jgi:hypothetical protein
MSFKAGVYTCMNTVFEVVTKICIKIRRICLFVSLCPEVAPIPESPKNAFGQGLWFREGVFGAGAWRLLHGQKYNRQESTG